MLQGNESRSSLITQLSNSFANHILREWPNTKIAHRTVISHKAFLTVFMTLIEWTKLNLIIRDCPSKSVKLKTRKCCTGFLCTDHAVSRVSNIEIIKFNLLCLFHIDTRQISYLNRKNSSRNITNVVGKQCRRVEKEWRVIISL